MSKRTASSNLDQDNWNEEEPPEEMGTFQRASSNDLKHRAIKRAKRRGMTSDGEKIPVFKNFTAFASSKTESSAPNFSFLSDDCEKPKLNSPNPFPSFNFSSVNSQAKLNSDVSANKSLPSSGNNVSFSFTNASSSGSTLKETKSPVSNETNTISSMTFGKSTSDGSSKPFDLNPPKGLDSSNKPSGGAMFKFGINNKEDSSKTSSEPMFQFGTNSKESEPLKTATSPPSFQFGFNSNDSQKSKSSIQSSSSLEAPKSPKVNGTRNYSTGSSSPKNSLFLAKLKALNIGVVNWIKQHVDKNQYINLTPIFEDYKKHFEEIKKKYDQSDKKPSEADSQAGKAVSSKDNHSSSTLNFQNKTSSSSSIPPFESSSKITSKSETCMFEGPTSVASSTISTNSKTNQTDKIPEVQPFSFGLNKSGNPSNFEDSKKSESSDFLPKSSTPMFSFGSDNAKSGFSFGSSDKKATFSFGSSDSSSKSSGFSFGIANDAKPSAISFDSATSPTSGFSFKPDASKSSTKDEDAKEATAEDDASDEVPKVEVTEVKEDDAIYEKKVKLFYKKGDKYVDRGVGTLFLKPAGDKTQLLIRALTNLGNILLNIILNDSIPTQRVGKNNVLIVCVPNPPIDPNSSSTPVSMLIRVKTGEDADELLKTVDEHK